MTDEATLRQMRAADPDASAWVAANAGSGKTRVLIDRVARLLLREVNPQHILCLTYTKAAASEMQNRLFKRLGKWAMKEDGPLRDELSALGEPAGAANLSRARQLFARAIETPGGLRIQTIHSFCATLLRRFPLEAQVSPGFTELDERAGRLLRAQLMEEIAADIAPDLVLGLARAWSGEDFGKLVERVAQQRVALAEPLSQARCRALFSVPQGMQEEDLLAEVITGNEALWLPDALTALRPGGVTDKALAEVLQQCLGTALSLDKLSLLESGMLYGAGAARPFGAKTDRLPTSKIANAGAPFVGHLHALMNRVESSRQTRMSIRAASKTATLHAFAAVFLPLYEARKAARGLLDFDDLIQRARGLLTDPSLAAWVLYRLDGGIDHILVDEAQDTSPDQWRVIECLAAEFTAGGDRRDRTLFVVGDKKQSIYSFQGADLAAFDGMRDRFAAGFSESAQPFRSIELQHSFRSSPAILDVVDATFPEENPALGGGVRHIAFRDMLPGRVDLWPVIPKSDKEEDGDGFDPVDRLSDAHHAVVLGRKVAAEIAQMIASDTRIPQEDGTSRPVHAGDFLILVRKRSAFFEEIIRACKALGLPIAGADRLKLGAELAVKDLAALLSFLALPEDDLSLAALLRSPLCGWSEAALHDVAQGRQGYLWTALRNRKEAYPETFFLLDDLRSQTDFLRPYDLIERVLTRHGGRRRLIARLGPEAEDGIDSFLAQALAYEQNEVPSLTGFLIWLETEEVEVKRQLGAEGHLIRVMTVHGAKGLEAPVVILPDTADSRPQDKDELYRLPEGPVIWKTPGAESPPLVAEERARRVALEAAERLRLLYVALTRARSWLIVAAAGEVKKPDGWYALVQAGLSRLSAARLADGGLRHAFGDWPKAAEPPSKVPPPTRAEALAPWLHLSAATPARPVEPLSPSALGGAKSLPGEIETEQDEEAGLLRGRQLHLLLEHMPGADPAAWSALAAALIADPVARSNLLAEAAGVLSDPALARLFLPGSLTEVSLTAEISGRRLFGAIDRLILGPDSIRVIDFKSNRRIPVAPEDVPEGNLRQMGAYTAALAQIYPGRQIEAAILWTRAPLLMPLPPAIVTAALLRATRDRTLFP